MPSSACPPWQTDKPASPAGERNDQLRSYTTSGDTIPTLADRKKALTAIRSRCPLSITSTKAPLRSRSRDIDTAIGPAWGGDPRSGGTMAGVTGWDPRDPAMAEAPEHCDLAPPPEQFRTRSVAPVGGAGLPVEATARDGFIASYRGRCVRR